MFISVMYKVIKWSCVMSKQIELKISHSFDSNIEAAWLKLEDHGSHYAFQRFNWLKHWQYTIGEADGIEPIIIAAYENDEPLALFPLCLHRIFGIRVIKFLGGDQSDYNAPIILPDRFTLDGFIALWKEILDLLPAHDVRYFVRVPEQLGSTNNPFLLNSPSQSIEGYAYSTKLDSSWGEFKQRKSKKLLKDNARMIRRLSEMGHIEICEPTSDEQYQKIIETTISQKTQRYLETGVRNIFSSESVRQFYVGLYAGVVGDPKVHLTALKVDDQILATHLGVYDCERYYYLFPTFDTGPMAKYSPGRLLLEHLVKLSIEKELGIFDFTVGGEAYKQKWCDSEMRLYRIVEANTPQGFLYVWMQRLILWAKRNQHARSFLTSGIRFFRKLSGQNGK